MRYPHPSSHVGSLLFHTLGILARDFHVVFLVPFCKNFALIVKYLKTVYNCKNENPKHKSNYDSYNVLDLNKLGKHFCSKIVVTFHCSNKLN